MGYGTNNWISKCGLLYYFCWTDNKLKIKTPVAQVWQKNIVLLEKTFVKKTPELKKHPKLNFHLKNENESSFYKMLSFFIRMWIIPMNNASKIDYL